jgi:hypothetical protein
MIMRITLSYNFSIDSLNCARLKKQYPHANIRGMPLWTELSQHITDATGAPFQVRRQRSAGGGSINSAYVAILFG